jgi:hypothetical protein
LLDGRSSVSVGGEEGKRKDRRRWGVRKWLGRVVRRVCR